MAFSIQCSGFLEYLEPVNDEEDGPRKEIWVHHDAQDVRGAPHTLEAKPSYKDDDAEHQATFSLETDVGVFEWTVTYSLGLSGGRIEDSYLSASPDVKFVDEIVFENAHQDDEDF